MKSLVDYTNELHDYFAKNSTIAPVEADATSASQGYNVGDQLVLDSVLYNVTADITAGDPLATTGAGANISAASDITTQLGNVKQALSNEVETRAKNGAHNLLPCDATSQSNANKPTFTVNSDGSILVNGTNSSGNDIFFPICSYPVLQNMSSYILTGCPSGGANDTYHLLVQDWSDNTIFGRDTGNGVSFTSTNNGIKVFIVIRNGKTVSNLTFRPMVRLATDADTTYRPYVPTNSQLLSYKDNGVLGAKNFASGKFTTVVNNGITYTANANDSVSFSGTIGSQNDYSLADSAVFTLKAGTYILSKNPVPGSGTNRSTVRLFISGGSAVVTLTTEKEGTFTLANDSNVYIRIAFNGTGQSYSGTFYPMIRLASDTDPTYQPYAKTNQELTNDAIKIKLASVNIDSLTIAAGGSGDVKKSTANIGAGDLGLPNNSLVACVMAWSTGHICVSTQCYVSNNGNSIILSLYNPTTSSATVTSVDLYVFYK